MRRATIALLAATVAGCGNQTVDELPPAAVPARSPALSAEPAGRVVVDERPRAAGRPSSRALFDEGRQVAVLARRARELHTFDAGTLERTGRVPVGVAPAHVASNGRGTLYVTDPGSDGVVVLRSAPRLEVTRRVALPGGAPWAIAHDAERGRLWVTLPATNELAELAAGTRPFEIARHPAVRQPNRVAVDAATGEVAVRGAGRVQRFDPPWRRRSR